MSVNKRVIFFVYFRKYLKFAVVFIQKVHQKFTDDFAYSLLTGDL